MIGYAVLHPSGILTVETAELAGVGCQQTRHGRCCAGAAAYPRSTPAAHGGY